MSQQQEATVEQLISIIQTIQTKRLSGTLIARRGNRATFEEGFILFVKGQIVQTKVGRRNGPEALNWLSTWRSCRYLFMPSNPSDAVPLQPPSTQDRPQTPVSAPSVRPRQPITEPINERHTEPITGSHRLTSTAIPYRTRSPEDALRLLEQQHFSRMHRHLFLLVNGQRTIAELVRLLRHNEQEVLAMLKDMERATIIKVSPPS